MPDKGRQDMTCAAAGKPPSRLVPLQLLCYSTNDSVGLRQWKRANWHRLADLAPGRKGRASLGQLGWESFR